MGRLLILTLAITLMTGCSVGTAEGNRNISNAVHSFLDAGSSISSSFFEKYSDNQCELDIPRIQVDTDMDQDGIKDMDDILEGARKDMENKPKYRSAYYEGGYPPDNEGVCTDVIWRALQNAGYNLKEMIDNDIRENMKDYPRVSGKPDPNIDFRRVKNLVPFFKKYAVTLTTEIIPRDEENLKEWQGGDIVVYGEPLEHIAVVSDQRRKDGVPYIIHNGGPYTKENDMLLRWHSPIIYHFRFPDASLDSGKNAE
ncbi:MAG: DUF1287 domain-containing protein [Acetivibrionales bacterium]